MNSYVAFNIMATLSVQNNGDFINGEVLDVGCGAKPYKRLFYDPDGDTYGNGVTGWTGLDVRPVGEITEPIENSGIWDDTYDTVLCVDVLSTVVDPLRAFSEMVRVLKPGGHLIVVEPNTREEDAEAYWGFRVNGLMMLADMNGCDIIKGETGSKLWAGEAENFRGQSKYGFILPGEFAGWVDALDIKYPNVSVLVAVKKGEQ